MFNDFIGLYPVQKTLRFELKPMEETKTFLDVSDDFLRAKIYPVIKEAIDDYYRFFIEETLPVMPFEKKDIKELFESYNLCKKEKNKQNEKEYNERTNRLCKLVSEYLNSRMQDYDFDKDGYGKLLKKGSLFRQWLEREKTNGNITKEQYMMRENAISVYNGFATCLSGFQENRKNIFAESGATSIAFRIVENMERFFDNCNNYTFLCGKYTDIAAAFENLTDYFAPEKYFSYITQKSIDRYNAVIGREADAVNAKGANQKLNEYAQKNGLKRREVPQMSVLYKQILSEKEKFLSEPIEDDKGLLQMIGAAYKEMEKTVEALRNVVDVDMDTGDGIFVLTKCLTDLSSNLFAGEENAWMMLGNAISVYCANNGIKKDAFKTSISLVDLQKALDEYTKEEGIKKVDVREYFRHFSMGGIRDAIEGYRTICDLKELDENRELPTEFRVAGKGYEQIQIIKKLLDEFVNALHFYKPLYLVKDGNEVKPDGMDVSFYNDFVMEYEKLSAIIPLYNKTRNYLTTVTKIDKKKIRTFLGSSSLLSGWSREIENNGCYIFIRDGKYYLAEILDCKEIDFTKFNADDGKTKRVYYFLQKLDSKNFPRVFIGSDKFKERANRYPLFKEVKKIYEEKKYLKSAPIPQEEYHRNLKLMIDYYKYALSVHESYKDIVFSFKSSEEYKDIMEFFNDAMKCGYSIEKKPADFSYLSELEKAHKLFLFQIYNKDFSEFSKGTKNLHTMYFTSLFSDENIENMKNGRPFFQLNGGAQIYTRERSIEPKVTHPANVPLENKNPLNERKQSLFTYNLIKDKRYSERKMFLHFPITMNCGTEKFKGKNFNVKVNTFLAQHPDVNVIGLDRGERHLLYYSVIDRKGNILEQNSFNVLESAYNGGKVRTDYHSLLDTREKARDEARKTWGKIESIADLKEGYLSAVIPYLAKLMLKYNAILVLENLNKGMKNSRIKVEKQVYQKFEHAIIDKLNYLVFKDRMPMQEGGVLRGYQLTDYLEQYKDIGKQTGFMFYVDPSYTSKICPKTGFVGMLPCEYTSIARAKDFFALFDSIRYNGDNNYFEFTFDYDKFGDFATVKRKKWTVCSVGERWQYSVKERKYVCVSVTERLKELFTRYGIRYENGELKEQIVAVEEKDFFEKMMRYLKLTMQMRNTNGGTGDDNDYMLSPVKGEDGAFFDSRIAKENEPKNADANGAYHIALKGLWILQNVKEDGTVIDCERKDWFAFRQK